MDEVDGKSEMCSGMSEWKGKEMETEAWGCGDVGDRWGVIEPWDGEGHLDSTTGGLHQAQHCIVQAHLAELELVILDSFSVRPACIVCC